MDLVQREAFEFDKILSRRDKVIAETKEDRLAQKHILIAKKMLSVRVDVIVWCG